MMRSNLLKRPCTFPGCTRTVRFLRGKYLCRQHRAATTCRACCATDRKLKNKLCTECDAGLRAFRACFPRAQRGPQAEIDANVQEYSGYAANGEPLFPRERQVPQ